ncbi:MAG: tRNA lysidine(34) synthetase TilS, partial [Verrucomicrobia bacterium]|nr:tRNA lysidine(34) synthetase TilS [Verrucomicrobiota bacterium]
PAHSGSQAAEILSDRIVEPEDHFNTESLAAVATALEGFGEQEMPLRELIDLLEELLEDATVRPRDSHEQGVWILNPHDAVGLDFDLVLFAGLNEGEFPGVPQQDALLSDKERRSLWKHLEEQGRRLPKLALPAAGVLFEQESVLFLTALGMAREQLVLSYQAVDQEGNEKGAGEYYRKLWNLAGWCARDIIVLNPYDQWRIEQLGEESVFSSHWNRQKAADPEDRIPMPGESFLPIIPLPLCRAKDEALQAAVREGQAGKPAPHVEQAFLPAQSWEMTIEHGTGWKRDHGRGAGILPAEASFDAGKVGDSPIEVRSFEPGDRMHPLGMEGSRKLQDIFTDQKIPRAQRPSVPVVVCRGEIIWIPGYRTARGWEVPGTDAKAVHVRIESV